MTQREGHATGGAGKVAPRPALVPAPPAGNPARAQGAKAPSWDELFRSLPAGQRQELLTLARRQGLLYAHQLPAAGNGTPADHARTLFARLLAGRTEDLEPVYAPPVDVTDPGLDPDQ